MINLRTELHHELLTDILPYWMEKMPDRQNGGFYGRIDGHEVTYPQETKGLVLNARILWTFAAAYRMENNPQYLETARRAYQYIKEYFIDKEYGGVFWELDYLGQPLNTRKHIYSQGFALYAFTEYYRATGEPEALELSKELFRIIEKYARDNKNGGYFDALSRDWQPTTDFRLSDHDANEEKTMNTHLHILEPYTNLLRIWNDEAVREALKGLINTFRDHIVDRRTGHLTLYFNRYWNSAYDTISYGHDIEAAWLLYEAAQVLADDALTEEISRLSVSIADAAYQGLQRDGSMIYEKDSRYIDKDRHWWIQAETIVGSVYIYKITGENKYLDIARRCWQYVKDNIIDHENGEWRWGVYANGKPNKDEDKAGCWKCPYHNARMCMEVLTI